MILASTSSRIDGYQIVGYKGAAQGATFDDLLKNTKALGANAVLNVCYDNALSIDTLFHGSAVFVEPIAVPPAQRTDQSPAAFAGPRTELNGQTLTSGS